MATKRCEYCHKEIPDLEYSGHVNGHLERRADGQQKEYATLPPQEREDVEAAFALAPRWYQHDNCGAVTGMPEEIIRTYLKDPWFYTADWTFCTGCHKHVPNSECTWGETGENLQRYMDNLRNQDLQHDRHGCVGKAATILGAIIGTVCGCLASLFVSN